MHNLFHVSRLLVVCVGLLTGIACQQDVSSQDPLPDTSSTTSDPSANAPQSTDTPLVTANIGKQVSVTREVAKTNVSRAGHHFLEVKTRDLVLFCPQKNVVHFSGDGPAVLYKGKTILVTGELERFKGNLQIVLHDPAQVQIVGNRAPSIAKPTRPPAASNAGALQKIGKTTWKSPVGLVYRGHDPDGLTRVQHVLRHAKDDPKRPGPHGVYDAKNEQQVFAVIDEAWEKIKSNGIKPKSQGRRDRYIVPMNRRIGYLGGQAGIRRRNPALVHLCIIVESNTTNVVTAYPQ